MKTFTLLFTLFYYFNALAAAPYGIKGQEQSTLYSNVHQFPNKQVTNIGGINALVSDCGSSNNLLENCGFEGPSGSQVGWTLWNGSVASELVDVKQGKKSYKLSLVGQELDFFQTSTLNATAFADGVNGSISLAVKTTVSNVYLCRTDSAGAVVASTNGTEITNCVKVSNSGKWGDYVMPIILGATSNGLKLVSLTPTTAAAVTVTGDVFVDSGILEAGLRTQIVNNIGPWTTCTVTGTWIVNTAYSCKFRQVGENHEYQMEAATSGAPTSANLAFNLPTGHVIDTTKMTAVSSNYPYIPNSKTSINDSGSIIYEGPVFADTTTQILPGVSNSATTYTYGAAITQIAPVTFGAGDKVAVTFSVPIVGLAGSTSVYTSTNGDTDWAACNFSTLAWQGLGTVTNNTKCKRQGSDLLMMGYIIAGTVTGSEARIQLPLWGSAQLAATADQGVIFGNITRGNGSASSNKDFVGIESTLQSNPFINVGIREYATASNPGAAVVGSSVSSTGEAISFNLRIPITGWTNSNVIVGSFSDLNYVAARGTQSSGQSIPVTTVTTVTYNTETYDTHGALNAATGVFTAPLNGYYKASATILYAAGSWSAGDYIQIVLSKNGASYSADSELIESAVSGVNRGGEFSDTVYLSRGDTLSVGLYTSRTGSLTLEPNSVLNFFSITRIPGQ